MKNNIKTLRAAFQLTQSDLAEKIEVSRQTVNAIEKGKFDPSLPTAFRLAAVFNCSIEELFIYESEE
ncbi:MULTISPECIES: helix-turn-helix transcriptional regulator [Leeuwenhoekiella]|uniref:Transcriptional regulator, XRE family n=1 Tax=Leeuwenhoekiella palythoae TaxID=573501 RepID=A0A1M5VL20_9FLAO|nr:MULTISPECIES: helix-turn-helix transcriptional regulator [Leeuwenhoekiella]MBH11350.1 transcriptional regulator [Leeuwenhoekiella sp.]MEC7781903.1 helix-turn-helix transcriptional regulator [Bacteroidota bacterium]MBH13799.1 transcriptional regulator [Leeuwenhoekiella sp.]MEC8884502.1 helix-turn-helix transcriptional regulator [Bacteroidota bacterium]MEE3147069.1 helix-turn-helix transcriptional regulator [Bacteroidota bacterium]|tara:strand:- start:3968 stop:4168 length:201 start_codon:yes stop_codon:yes gene_type:complete